MKKFLSTMVAVAALSAPAVAADMPVKAKAAPVAATPAWDIAVGGVVMSDYNFRGVSQSNRGPSGGAYFEPQYNIGFGTLYVGVAAWAIDWPNGFGFSAPSAEVDIYGGWRNTWGAFSLDLGTIYYYYPKETLGVGGFTTKSDFVELYAKASYAITPDLTVGANVFYSPDVLHYSTSFCTATAGANCSKADGVYASITGKWVTPLSFNGVGLYLSGELGHWWLDGTGFVAAGAGTGVLGAGLDPDYTYWNVGAALTYKALTLDFRYHDTDMSRLQCAAFLVTVVPNGSNNWCNSAFIVSAKFDTTLSALK